MQSDERACQRNGSAPRKNLGAGFQPKVYISLVPQRCVAFYALPLSLQAVRSTAYRLIHEHGSPTLLSLLGAFPSTASILDCPFDTPLRFPSGSSSSDNPAHPFREFPGHLSWLQVLEFLSVNGHSRTSNHQNLLDQLGTCNAHWRNATVTASLLRNTMEPSQYGMCP